MTDFFYADSDIQTQTQLILCIEECDNNNNCPVDTRLFIGYSRNSETFFVRGRRDDTKISNYVPYGFECIYENDLYEFIKLKQMIG